MIARRPRSLRPYSREAPIENRSRDPRYETRPRIPIGYFREECQRSPPSYPRNWRFDGFVTNPSWSPGKGPDGSCIVRAVGTASEDSRLATIGPKRLRSGMLDCSRDPSSASPKQPDRNRFGSPTHPHDTRARSTIGASSSNSSALPVSARSAYAARPPRRSSTGSTPISTIFGESWSSSKRKKTSPASPISTTQRSTTAT